MQNDTHQIAYLAKYAKWKIAYLVEYAIRHLPFYKIYLNMQFGTKKSWKTRIFITLHLVPHTNGLIC